VLLHTQPSVLTFPIGSSLVAVRCRSAVGIIALLSTPNLQQCIVQLRQAFHPPLSFFFLFSSSFIAALNISFTPDAFDFLYCRASFSTLTFPAEFIVYRCVCQQTKETPAIPSASGLRYCTKVDMINTRMDFRPNVHIHKRALWCSR